MSGVTLRHSQDFKLFECNINVRVMSDFTPSTDDIQKMLSYLYSYAIN